MVFGHTRFGNKERHVLYFPTKRFYLKSILGGIFSNEQMKLRIPKKKITFPVSRRENFGDLTRQNWERDHGQPREEINRIFYSRIWQAQGKIGKRLRGDWKERNEGKKIKKLMLIFFWGNLRNELVGFAAIWKEYSFFLRKKLYSLLKITHEKYIDFHSKANRSQASP